MNDADARTETSGAILCDVGRIPKMSLVLGQFCSLTQILRLSSLALPFIHTLCLTSKTSSHTHTHKESSEEMPLLPTENRYRLRAALMAMTILYFVVAGVYQFLYRTPYLRQFKEAHERELNEAMLRNMDDETLNNTRQEVFLPLWLTLYLFYVFSLLYLLLFFRIVIRARLVLLAYSCLLFVFIFAILAWDYFAVDLGDQPWEMSTHNLFTRGAYDPLSGRWVSFEQHVASLDSDRAHAHEKKTTLVELVLAFKVTLLTIVFYIVMKFFPKPRETTPKTDSYEIEMQPDERDASDNV